ncbi:MAG: pantetheine-phosphate adenylyltransferase [Candidatus Margulisbacteria bacterium]|nr:pantetheine-phosphate adenylyltransferase [Candidatus Margulisiibacteriota bacterium]
MEKVAIYPGSFDPITNGHISIIKRALRIFDRLIVGVSESETKHPIFSMKERVQLISELNIPNLTVKSFKGLLIDFCKKENTQVIIRGLRAVSDFDYEFQLALANRRMDRDIETVFLMTDYKYSYLSSSIVKDMARFNGDITGLVPEHVSMLLKERFAKHGNS